MFKSSYFHMLSNKYSEITADLKFFEATETSSSFQVFKNLSTTFECVSIAQTSTELQFNFV